MPSIRHCFSLFIYYEDGANLVPNTGGIEMPSRSSVEELGEIVGTKVSGSGASGRQLDVDLDENDPRLAKLYDAIYTKYQVEPSRWKIIPMSERARFFGVKRKVTWTEQEINAAEFLELSASRQIASHENPDDEHWEREDYVAELDKKQNTDVQLGIMSPFHGLAVAEPLMSSLLAANLVRLNLTPVVFTGGGKIKKPLWALKSHVILPDTLNSIQNGHGDIVASNKGWERFESRHLDDAGRDPPTLRYRRAELEALEPFDIAMTSARFGNGREIAYRWCVISQKFRAELKRLKIPGVSYVPVVTEE